MDPHVIILDSSQIYTDALCRLLYKAGVYNISKAHTLEQFLIMEPALERAALILMDIQFPTEEQGLAVLRHLKSNPKYTGTPVVVLTERNRPQVEKKLKDYPIAQFIQKPYKPEHLMKVLDALLVKVEDPVCDFSTAESVQLTPAAYIQRELKVAARLNLCVSLIVISPLDPASSAAPRRREKGCLSPVRHIVQKNLRSIDQVFLSGTNEILAVLSATDEEGAETVLEKIVAEVAMNFNNKEMEHCGNFYGVSVTFPQDGNTLDALMQKAFSMISSKRQLERLSATLDTQMAGGHYIYKKIRRYL